MTKYKNIDWDAVFVHGEHPDTNYIRHMENQAALKLIAPHLVRAVAKRRALFEEHTSIQRQIIQLAERAIVLLRELQLRNARPVAFSPCGCLSHNPLNHDLPR